MRELLRYLRGYGKECVLAPLFKLLEAAFQLFVPLVVARIIDQGIARGDQGLVIALGALLVGLAVVGLASAICAQWFASKLAAGFGTALRNDLFRHILTLSQEDVDRLGTSALVTRVTYDSQQVQDGVNWFFRLILRSPFVVFGCMAMAFAIDGTQGLVFLVTIAVLFVIVALVMRRTIGGLAQVQALLDGVAGRTTENLSGVRTIRAFNREDHERQQMAAAAGQIEGLQVGVGRISALTNPLTYVAINLGLIAVLATGGVAVDMGHLTTGDIVALVNYVSQILVELIKLAGFVVTEARMFASARRITDVFHVKPSMADGTLDARQADGSFEFRDVTFAYPGASEPAVEYLSFAAAPGETVGVIGGTGSGKSTVVELLSRTYDASSGEVLVGGEPVSRYQLRSLHEAMGVVEQRVRLFSGSLGDNLRWGKGDADQAELERATALAQAADVLATRPEGFAAPVEERGRNFSGGQRQRLSIARALARERKILVLDDATSALDFATEAALRHMLATEFPATTKLVVSQRVSAVRHADRIVVLDGGVQVGCGTHEELLEGCEVYRQICASQLALEEVAPHE